MFYHTALSLLDLKLVHLGDGDHLVTGTVGSLPRSTRVLPAHLGGGLSQPHLLLIEDEL